MVAAWEVVLNGKVKCVNLGSATKILKQFRSGGLDLRFWIGNGALLPGEAGRDRGVKTKTVDHVQDLYSEALCPE